MTKRECAIVMAYTGTCMLAGDDLNVFYQYVTEIMGAPVYTHELAFQEVQDELKRRSKSDFLGLCRTAKEGSE